MASVSFGDINHGLQIGDNYGSINAEFHLPPGQSGTRPGGSQLTNHRVERPETPPSPLSTIPFTRDPDFVNRDAILNRIREKSSVSGSRIALIGLGGVG